MTNHAIRPAVLFHLLTFFQTIPNTVPENIYIIPDYLNSRSATSLPLATITKPKAVQSLYNYIDFYI